MYGAYGVVAALHERARTGKGQVVRTSLLAAVVGVHGFQGTAWTVAGELGRARGNHHPSISPYGLFRCRDGAVQIACGSEGLWRRLCAEFGLDPDMPDMATNGERAGHPELVRKVVEDAFAADTADALLQRLDRAGVPAGRVRSIDEVYGWAQTRSQGLLVDVEHASLGPLTLPGPPLRFFDAADTERPARRHAAPPVLDQHGEQIRAEFGSDSGQHDDRGRSPRLGHAARGALRRSAAQLGRSGRSASRGLPHLPRRTRHCHDP